MMKACITDATRKVFRTDEWVSIARSVAPMCPYRSNLPVTHASVVARNSDQLLALFGLSAEECDRLLRSVPFRKGHILPNITQAQLEGAHVFIDNDTLAAINKSLDYRFFILSTKIHFGSPYLPLCYPPNEDSNDRVRGWKFCSSTDDYTVNVVPRFVSGMDDLLLGRKELVSINIRLTNKECDDLKWWVRHHHTLETYDKLLRALWKSRKCFSLYLRELVNFLSACPHDCSGSPQDCPNHPSVVMNAIQELGDWLIADWMKNLYVLWSTLGSVAQLPKGWADRRLVMGLLRTRSVLATVQLAATPLQGVLGNKDLVELVSDYLPHEQKFSLVSSGSTSSGGRSVTVLTRPGGNLCPMMACSMTTPRCVHISTGRVGQVHIRPPELGLGYPPLPLEVLSGSLSSVPENLARRFWEVTTGDQKNYFAGEAQEYDQILDPPALCVAVSSQKMLFELLYRMVPSRPTFVMFDKTSAKAHQQQVDKLFEQRPGWHTLTEILPTFPRDSALVVCLSGQKSGTSSLFSQTPDLSRMATLLRQPWSGLRLVIVDYSRLVRGTLRREVSAVLGLVGISRGENNVFTVEHPPQLEAEMMVEHPPQLGADIMVEHPAPQLEAETGENSAQCVKKFATELAGDLFPCGGLSRKELAAAASTVFLQEVECTHRLEIVRGGPVRVPGPTRPPLEPTRTVLHNALAKAAEDRSAVQAAVHQFGPGSERLALLLEYERLAMVLDAEHSGWQLYHCTPLSPGASWKVVFGALDLLEDAPVMLVQGHNVLVLLGPVSRLVFKAYRGAYRGETATPAFYRRLRTRLEDLWPAPTALPPPPELVEWTFAEFYQNPYVCLNRCDIGSQVKIPSVGEEHDDDNCPWKVSLPELRPKFKGAVLVPGKANHAAVFALQQAWRHGSPPRKRGRFEAQLDT